MFFSKKFDPSGKHCYIGGASEGLGLALACLLVELGANVSIVSRSEAKLAIAVGEIEKHRTSPEQIVQSFACDLSDSAAASATYKKATSRFSGDPPYAVFTCAGGCTPGLFVDRSADEHWASMELNFRTALNTVHGFIKDVESVSRTKPERPREGTHHVVFTASIVAMISFPGYATYSPSKYALRGLVESLRAEAAAYGIATHLYLPGTILSPGFEREQQLKPAVTKVIEGADPAMHPRDVAVCLVRGLERGHTCIATDILNNMFRMSHGFTPGNGILDVFLAIAAMIVMPIVRVFLVDREMRKARDLQLSPKRSN